MKSIVIRPLAVTFDTVTRRKAKDISLRFTTNKEVSTEDFAELDRVLHQEGWLVFKPNDITLDDIPTTNAPSDNKSPSQRLKAVLYVLYMTKDRAEDFDVFYRNRMNAIIDQVKDKLPKEYE